MANIARSYRIRAYPNGAQRRLLDQWFGGVRWLWNTALEIRSAAYRECGLSLTGSDLSRWLTQWKHTSGHEWLAEIPSTALTQCLRDQDDAFRNFFALRARYPRFKRKRYAGSLRFQRVGAVCWMRGIVSVPKLGPLKLAEALPQVERPHMVVAALARGRHARAIHEAAFGEIRRHLTYKCEWYGKILEPVDRWYPSSRTCSVCRHKLDELRLDERQWRCPKCGSCHDRDINAARNVLTEGLRQLAGCDDRDPRVDARGACSEEILEQVLAEEARSGHRSCACPEQAPLR